MNDGILVNDLPLPVALVEAIKSGTWRTPASRVAWRSLFPEEEIVQPILYPLGEMRGQDSRSGLTGHEYLGHVDEVFVPGDSDQSRAVLIADLGPERPIALDYRGSGRQPSVVELTSQVHFCWRRGADDIELLMRALGLTE